MDLSVFDCDELRMAFLDAADPDGESREKPEGAYARQRGYARDRAEKGYCERDLWDIEGWFLRIMPAMLRDFKAARHGSPGRLGENYVNEDGFLVNDKCHAEWDAILDRMARLFEEACEATCSRANPYDGEHDEAYRLFEEKYGAFGEKLSKPGEDDRHGKVLHFMSEVDEFREIDRKWSAAEREIAAYRADCRRQAMELFAEWLPDLVD